MVHFSYMFDIAIKGDGLHLSCKDNKIFFNVNFLGKDIVNLGSRQYNIRS